MAELTKNQITAIKKLLADKSVYSTDEEGNEKTRLDHIIHCFWQMERFPREALGGKEFREGQFYYNMGRAQEILLSIANHKFWWKIFEPLSIKKDYKTILNKITVTRKLLDIPEGHN